MQRWLVKVYDGEKHAYSEGFWTKAKAVEFMSRISNGSDLRWRAELVRIGK